MQHNERCSRIMIEVILFLRKKTGLQIFFIRTKYLKI